MPKPIARAAPSISHKLSKPSNRTIIVAMAVFGLIALLGLLCFCRSAQPVPVITRPPAFSDHNAVLEKIHTDPESVLKSEDYAAHPLHKAILENDARQLEDLCKSADCKKWLMQKDLYGVTPLFYLIVHPKRGEMQSIFLQHTATAFTDWEACKAQKLPDGKSPFHTISDYDIGALPNFSSYGIQVTEKMWQNFFDDWSYQYPLHYAVKQDDVRAIKWLAKANYPMLKEHGSETALQYAIGRGNDATAYFVAMYKGAKKGDLKLAKDKNLILTTLLLEQESD